jgi:hypothetical protein
MKLIVLYAYLKAKLGFVEISFLGLVLYATNRVSTCPVDAADDGISGEEVQAA